MENKFTMKKIIETLEAELRDGQKENKHLTDQNVNLVGQFLSLTEDLRTANDIISTRDKTIKAKEEYLERYTRHNVEAAY